MRFRLCAKSCAQNAGRIRTFEFFWIWRHQRRAHFPALVREVGFPSSLAAPGSSRIVRSALRGPAQGWKGARMNIIVCIKQVPGKDAPMAIAGNWIKESDIGFEMNEPDSYALEEALRLKEKHGGEVVALSMGPERVKQTIKEGVV